MKPYLPESYNFVRDAFFKKIGAVGYSISDLSLSPGKNYSILSKINNIRDQIQQRVNKEIGSKFGSIATALMINEYSNIEKDTLKDLRATGLAHILSVSGMHLSLVATIFFFTVRLLLNCLGNLPLIYNTKKIAAFISMLGTLSYLLISGMEVAAIRSFIMCVMILVAIIIDRNTDPLRTVSLAASIILIFAPENIVHPSFQMSFSAVMALVACYDIYLKFGFNNQSSNYFKKIMLYCLSICFASLVAGLATTPFAIYHFGQSANYSILANLLAVPITSFWLMPCVVITFLLLPFNLEKFSLYIMKIGIKLIVQIASFIAKIPNSVTYYAKLSDNNLLIITLGMILFCILKSKIRILGLFVMFTGVIFQIFSPKANIFIDWDIGSIAVLSNKNELIFLKSLLPKFKREILMSYLGASTYLIYPQGKDEEFIA